MASTRYSRTYNQLLFARVRLAYGCLPAGIGESASLIILGATKGQSLSLALQTPDITLDSFGDYTSSLRYVEPTFVNTLISASELDGNRIISLFPEKVDLVRVLNHVQRFSPGPGEPLCRIDGLVDSKVLIFKSEVREWVEETLPSTEPENIHVLGLVKSGRLGNQASFQIFDGNRSVVIDPDAVTIPKLKGLFGQVVNLIGVAQYSSSGAIRRVSAISELERYAPKQSEIRVGNRRITLRKPLQYNVGTDDRGVEFIVESPDLDIHAYGRSLTEAINAANEEFVAIWDSIGNEEEDELYETALPLRRLLRDYVAEESTENGEHASVHG
jgi:hypothetical protein